MNCSKKIFSFLLLFSLSNGVFANDFNGADTAWILTSTALVLLMTLPGLALFYGGLVSSKNVLSVLAQCFAIAAIISILWFSVGYSLAFGGAGVFIGDFSKIFMMGVGKDSLVGTIPEILFAMFQMTFAIITPALIVGAFAERMKFSAMLIFSSAWVLLVYVPIAHWVWGGGWLSALGVLDFAGGIVVHITAGIAAIVTSIVIGNRHSFAKKPPTPHNMTMAVTGAAMLWIGWFGFNGGSALSANSDAAMAILVTHLAAAAGVIAWASMEWLKYGKPTVLGMITGMVAGLGTITPASGFVGPAAGIIIGLLAGIICFGATNYIKQVLKIDDSLDVFPVHGVGGILGTLLTGVFATTVGLGIFNGFGFASGINTIAEQLQTQFIGVISTIVWTATITWIILKVLDVTMGIRVTKEQEQEGLDINLHEEKGYEIHTNN